MVVELQLQQLVENVRFEIGQSSNVAHGVNQRERIMYLLRRTQQELYEHHSWPQLKVYRDITLADGVYLYDFPDDISFEHIIYCSVPFGSEWLPVGYGIGDRELSTYAQAQEVDPVRRWVLDVDKSQIKVWPTPASTGALRVWGTKTLRNLIANEDYATLNSNMLVLFVASEILAKMKDESAQTKLQKANELLRRLRGRSSKGGMTTIGGHDPSSGRSTQKRPYLDYIPQGG